MLKFAKGSGERAICGTLRLKLSIAINNPRQEVMEDGKIKSGDWEGELLTEERAKLKRPDMYRIVLLNDDYTPREFVVWILMRVFFKSQDESTRIMLEAHTSGQSMVGVYTYDVATTKIVQVDKLAKQYEHPLKCILEVETGGEGE